MDVPQPPKDIELKNIIDKLAEFVARNGPEFESMTKSKQKGNPKFLFLYGGEFFNYYQYKVLASKQAQMKQPNQPPPLMGATIPPLMPAMPQIWSNPPPGGNTQNNNNQINSQIETLNTQQNTLREQIRQSEQNLQAQHGVLLTQQQSQIEEALVRAQSDWLQKQADEHKISLPDFDVILQPIIDSCTKDSISNGKSWILQHCTDLGKSQIISQYLLKKALINGVLFTQKLHLIYLVNDVIHHCIRKNADDLKKCLESAVIPMFCSAQMCSTEDQAAKLTKLLSLWESKSNFFDACVISKLKSPPSSLQEYQTSLLTQHASVITSITQATKATFENYQQQHQAFIQHASQQISMLETQKQQIEQQSLKGISQKPPPLLPELTNNGSPNLNRSNDNNGSKKIPSLLEQAMGTNNHVMMYPSINENQINPTTVPFQSGNDGSNSSDYTLPPPSLLIPDLSRPPPGFQFGGSVPASTTAETEKADLVPTIPYFELPAGLMVPLIRLEDYLYMPVDPALIRLPAPAPPNERLLSAVEAFYSPPSHDRPRDGEGWEKLALYEYFKVKNAAKKQKEEEIASGTRERSRSPSPIITELLKPPKKSKKRVYRSKSRSRSRSKSPEPKKQRSPKKSPRRKSKSPPPPPSPLPERESRIDRDRKERSLTPPSFGGNYAKAASDFIEESNKGHQMLMKMGWAGTGTGLGSQGQGIDAPISGGEVRNKKDMYKGVGINLTDPYESFRKNKGAAFITRMKARAEERS